MRRNLLILFFIVFTISIYAETCLEITYRGGANSIYTSASSNYFVGISNTANNTTTDAMIILVQTDSNVSVSSISVNTSSPTLLTYTACASRTMWAYKLLNPPYTMCYVSVTLSAISAGSLISLIYNNVSDVSFSVQQGKRDYMSDYINLNAMPTTQNSTLLSFVYGVSTQIFNLIPINYNLRYRNLTGALTRESFVGDIVNCIAGENYNFQTYCLAGLSKTILQLILEIKPITDSCETPVITPTLTPTPNPNKIEFKSGMGSRSGVSTFRYLPFYNPVDSQNDYLIYAVIYQVSVPLTRTTVNDVDTILLTVCPHSSVSFAVSIYGQKNPPLGLCNIYTGFSGSSVSTVYGYIFDNVFDVNYNNVFSQYSTGFNSITYTASCDNAICFITSVDNATSSTYPTYDNPFTFKYLLNNGTLAGYTISRFFNDFYYPEAAVKDNSYNLGINGTYMDSNNRILLPGIEILPLNYPTLTPTYTFTQTPTFTVTPTAFFNISKSADQEVYNPGDTVTFHIDLDITNQASGMEIWDTIPEGLSFVGASDGNYENNLWTYNAPSEYNMQRIAVDTTINTITMGALVSFNNKLWAYVWYGGVDYKVYSSEDGINWDLEGYPPFAVQQNNVVVYDNAIYVIGAQWNYPPYYRDYIYKSMDGVNFDLINNDAVWGNRYGHETIVFDGKLWLIGGYKIGEGNQNDIYSTTDGITWTFEGYGDFSVRMYHTVVEKDNKLYLMGGMAEDFYNDVWVSENGVDWELLTGNAAWAVRDQHQSAVFNDKIWIISGDNNYDTIEDIWYSDDGIDWYALTLNSNFLSRRHFLCAEHNDSIYFGWGYQYPEDIHHCDVYKITLQTGSIQVSWWAKIVDAVDYVFNWVKAKFLGYNEKQAYTYILINTPTVTETGTPTITPTITPMPTLGTDPKVGVRLLIKN